jgi:hypothetical protein
MRILIMRILIMRILIVRIAGHIRKCDMKRGGSRGADWPRRLQSKRAQESAPQTRYFRRVSLRNDNGSLTA